MNSSGTADTESFTQFTGGGGGGTTSSATNRPMKDEALDSSPFRVGEKVLAFHGPCLYDAKVQRVEHYMDEWRCHVHYIGWKKQRVQFTCSIWDEWLDVVCLLKHNEENVLKQEELRKEHGMEKSAKHGRLSQDKIKSSIGPRGKKREREIFENVQTEDECLVPQENLVNIQIPSTLKKQLVDDHECIVHLGQLVKLPLTPSVYEMLDKYFDYRVKKDGMIGQVVVDMVQGLRYYFDKALPVTLLYKEERQQYKEMIVNNISSSCVYGAQHLLRLFIKLPKMLSYMNIEMNTSTELLQQILVDLLRFLHNNESAYFHLSYQKSEGFIAVKKEPSDLS